MDEQPPVERHRGFLAFIGRNIKFKNSVSRQYNSGLPLASTKRIFVSVKMHY